MPDDVMKNAVISASVVYHLAMRDAMLPRFPAGQMPPLTGRTPAQQALDNAVAALQQGAPGNTGRGNTGRGNAPQPADSHVYVADRNKPLSVAAPGLLPLQPAQNPGSFVYTPANGFTGTDSFTYKATNGSITSAPGTVTVVVK